MVYRTRVPMEHWMSGRFVSVPILMVLFALAGGARAAHAQAIDRHTRSRDVPLWARQMEIFILEDMNQLEAAKALIARLLASGEIDDPAEIRFLAARLKALEARLGPGR